ncbi:hypothetical protein [Alkalibacillus aidingensis]|uniref:hypothetical protein n=1 Tax=Alkalibacillus aidingensis TaxID=2747607 RepID=UPI0016609CCF|nr:hypothetical protein [Alkalibacillus aidingensis]
MVTSLIMMSLVVLLTLLTINVVDHFMTTFKKRKAPLHIERVSDQDIEVGHR